MCYGPIVDVSFLNIIGMLALHDYDRLLEPIQMQKQHYSFSLLDVMALEFMTC